MHSCDLAVEIVVLQVFHSQLNLKQIRSASNEKKTYCIIGFADCLSSHDELRGSPETRGDTSSRGAWSLFDCLSPS